MQTESKEKCAKAEDMERKFLSGEGSCEQDADGSLGDQLDEAKRMVSASATAIKTTETKAR